MKKLLLLACVLFFGIVKSKAGSKGFYVIDQPRLTINPHNFFVDFSALPFNYQGTTRHYTSDFSWNTIDEKGLYIAKITAGAKRYTSKFVKQ